MRDVCKPAVSKSLVRNAEVPVLPTLTSITKKNDSAASQKRNNCGQTDKKNQRKEKASLGEPALNSALRIVKEMKHTSEMKPSRMQNSPDFTEKVTQKINVPYNEHLYHDLVALSVSDIPQSENLCNVKLKPHKQDRSPDLAEFHRPHCIPDIPASVSYNIPHHNHAPVWDGRSVYLLTQKVKHDCYD